LWLISTLHQTSIDVQNQFSFLTKERKLRLEMNLYFQDLIQGSKQPYLYLEEKRLIIWVNNVGIWDERNNEFSYFSRIKFVSKVGTKDLLLWFRTTFFLF